MTETPRTYTVIYRIGGPASFQWRKTIAYATLHEARRVHEDITRRGRKAHIFDAQSIAAVGLPETFNPPGANHDPSKAS